MLRICVNSQTPLVRFKVSAEELFEKYSELPEAVPIELLVRGEDYDFATGGVTRMLYPLLKELRGRKLIHKPHWVSLNPIGPEVSVIDKEIFLHRFEIEPHELLGYGHFKECMWRNVHYLGEMSIHTHYFSDFARYNWLCAQKMLDLHLKHDFDLFYLHDFQQLLVGSMLGPVAPKVFRWHIPVYLEKLLPEWREFLLKYLSHYDAVIVSCSKYKESLLKAGFKGRVCQIYPHIDERTYKKPSKQALNDFCRKFGIKDKDKIILVVARLDPMKGQNIAVEALGKVVKEFTEAKLLLVGDGSFSSAKRGGLGRPKGTKWHDELERIAKAHKVSKKLIFTGYASEEDLECAYTRADVTVLPSLVEGFGLVVIESWLYETPVVVSESAGVAELVKEGKNGYVFKAKDSDELATKISLLFSHPRKALELGIKGAKSAHACYLKHNLEKIWKVFREVVT
ncbi:MAG: glycosyltransferase family 4 protein [Candidatus Thermoplasmatota archaeon]|nr:glycosyltransferase family 4 protein [Candidatus Thermoplasmatota archaeon]